MIFLGFAVRSLNTTGGIRTHEAYALELKSSPFDRSGTVVFYINLIFLTYMLKVGFEPTKP